MMLVRGLAAAVVVAILDQLSKGVVLGVFAGRPFADRSIEVTRFFDLVLTYNRGMSFGLFNHGTGPNVAAFSAIAIVIVIGLVYWLRRAEHPLLALAIGLVIGGAVGNLIDRLRHGAVVDFLYFHIGSWYWPAFNLADSAICLGVAAMLLDGLLLHRPAH